VFHKMKNAANMERLQEILRCPICKTRMQVIHLRSLVCASGHCYDIARQGYINLLSRGSATKYGKKIFEHRRAIGNSGFFDPLHAAVSEIAINRLPRDELASLLDAGCGEGSHMANIQHDIMQTRTHPLLAVGIDIAKEGIGFASAAYANAAWCVADIANCPFADQQFAIILNILSPANYSEFRRLLTDDGVVIKVIPEQDYLRELREILYQGSAKQAYSNAHTQRHFREYFTVAAVERLRYRVDLSESLIMPLLGMTPLSWGASEDRVNQVRESKLKQVTMDCTIMVGRR